MFYSQQPYIYFPFYQTQMCYPIYFCSVQPSTQIQPVNQEKTQSQQDQLKFNLQKNHACDTDQDKSCDQSNENEKESFVTDDKKQSLKTKKTLKVLDTTNFHKNFAKAIVAYAIRQQFAIFRMLGEQKGQEFLELLQSLKNNLSNLTHFVKHTNNNDFIKTFRILGNNFLKKESIQYIYNSKVQQKSSHLKHKQIIKKTLLRI